MLILTLLSVEKKPDMMAQRTSRPSSIFSSYLNNVNLVARTLSLNAYHIVNAVIGKKKSSKTEK